MADINISMTDLSFNTFSTVPTLTDLTASDEMFLSLGRDDKCVLLITVSGVATITIHGGDGVQAGPDLTLQMTSPGSRYVTVESGRFTITRGEHSGTIKVTCSDLGSNVIVKVGGFKLP